MSASGVVYRVVIVGASKQLKPLGGGPVIVLT